MNVVDVLPLLAVSIAVCVELTADAVAVKEAEVFPAATVIEAGVFTEALPLVRLTTTPPLGAAAVKETLQLSGNAPLSVADEQVRLLIVDNEPEALL